MSNALTINVNAIIRTQDGTPLPSATVIATLDHADIDAGHIVKETQTFTTDSNGQVTMPLWPNSMGSTESRYRIKCQHPDNGQTVLDVMATIPHEAGGVPITDVDLYTVAEQPAYTGKNEVEIATAVAQQAALDAQASETKASMWADNPEDLPVEAGKYSAKHHAAKAAASAAGVNLPAIVPGDAGKMLRVNAGESGYQLASSMGKNVIINGGFDIWQRGTSQTSGWYGSDDRWINLNSGSTKTHSQQPFVVGQTEVAGNPKYYSRTNVVSVAGSTNYVAKEQRIESVRTLAGATVTLSFYAKADAAKNIALEFIQRFGTGGTPSSNVAAIGAQLVALTTAWKRYTVTLTIPSIAGKTLGTTTDGTLSVFFWFDAGANYNIRSSSLGQQSGTFDIAQVQLEKGAVATDFEYRSETLERLLCYRYYYRRQFDVVGSYVFNAQAYSVSNVCGKILDLPVPMRTTPAVGSVNPAYFAPKSSSRVTLAAFTAVNLVAANNVSIYTYEMSGSAGLVAGDCSVIVTTAPGAYIYADAEI